MWVGGLTYSKDLAAEADRLIACALEMKHCFRWLLWFLFYALL